MIETRAVIMYAAGCLCVAAVAIGLGQAEGKPTESTAALQEQIDGLQAEIYQLQGIVSQRNGELESYRLYASKTAESLVDLNKQLRESQAECERLQRENMRLERMAMGLSGETEAQANPP